MLVGQLSLRTAGGRHCGGQQPKMPNEAGKQLVPFRDTHIPLPPHLVVSHQAISAHPTLSETVYFKIKDYRLPFEELKKGDFHELFITPKWYPEVQEKKYVGTLTHTSLGKSEISLGRSVPRLFFYVKMPRHSFPQPLTSQWYFHRSPPKKEEDEKSITCFP